MKVVADIGGTNARFAIVSDDGQLQHVRRYLCSQHPSLEAVIEEYAADTGIGVSQIDQAAFSVAMPVTGDRIQLTNSPWVFSCSALKSRMGWSHLRVINDFAAIALSLPHLGTADTVVVGDAVAGDPAAPLLVLGPGTGLGVAGLLPVQNQWVPIATEGGHVTLSAHDDREAEILRLARQTGKHISAERLLSGLGLPLLHRLVCEVDALPFTEHTAQSISDAALQLSDPAAIRTLETFFEMLGSVAGNLTLSLGARGGVYLAGGILPRMRVSFAQSAFRRRFEDKGRFVSYLSPVPVRLIIHANPALVGLAFADNISAAGGTA